MSVGHISSLLLFLAAALAHAQAAPKVFVWAGTHWINTTDQPPIGAVQMAKGSTAKVWSGEMWVERVTWENGVTSNGSIWNGSEWVPEVASKNQRGYLKFPPDGTLKRWNGSAWEKVCYWFGVQLINGKSWRAGQWVSLDPTKKAGLTAAIAGCGENEFAAVNARSPASDDSNHAGNATAGNAGSGNATASFTQTGGVGVGNTGSGEAGESNSRGGNVTGSNAWSGNPTNGNAWAGNGAGGNAWGANAGGSNTGGGNSTGGNSTGGNSTGGNSTYSGGWGGGPKYNAPTTAPPEDGGGPGNHNPDPHPMNAN